MEWTPIVDCAYDCTISPGTATLTCDVAIQLLDFAGNDLTVPGVVQVYFSTSSAGLTIATVADITDGGDGSMVDLLDTELSMFVSATDGDIVVNFDGTGNVDYYCCVVLPNGKIKVSEKIEITA